MMRLALRAGGEAEWRTVYWRAGAQANERTQRARND